MITYEAACQKAYEYYKEISENYRLVSALENEFGWIFKGADSSNVECGGAGIKISRDDGKLEKFILPKELRLLQISKPVSIPFEFRW